MRLREYQQSAIDRVRAEFKQGRTRVILVSPTGSGKSAMGAAVVASAVAKGKRVLWVVHLRELIDQAWENLERAGIRHMGVIRGKDERRDDTAPVQCASIQTLIRRDYVEADVVIIDECHLSMAATWEKHVWNVYRDVPIIGLTATPIRTDRKGLGKWFQSMVEAAKYSELIEQGFVAKPLVYGPARAPDMNGVKVYKGDYDTKDMTEVMAGLAGDIVPSWQRFANGYPTIGFAASVEHSKDLTSRFCEAGVAAEHLDGKTPADERKAILARLRSGKTTVVWNNNILVAGFDAPMVRCVIVARATLSLVLHMQSAGRCLRPGEIQPVIIDHANNCMRHGHPHIDREWSLDGVTRESTTGGRYVTCKACFAQVRYSKICEACGADIIAAERAPRGVPAEDTSAEMALLTVQDVEREMFVELVSQAMGRGMKPGWVAHQFKAKFNHWPTYAWKVETDKLYAEDEAWQRNVEEQGKKREFWQSKKRPAEAAE